MPEEKGHGPKQYTIFINDVRHQVTEQSLTGVRLKALGGIDPGNRLFLEGPGSHPDQPIGDAETVELRPGMKFYDLPPGVVG